MAFRNTHEAGWRVRLEGRERNGELVCPACRQQSMVDMALAWRWQECAQHAMEAGEAEGVLAEAVTQSSMGA